MRRLLFGVVVAMASLGSIGSASAADADGVTQFGIGLYQKIGGKENVVFSPYNIYSCLAMAYAGADGKTRAQIAQVLTLPLEKSALNAAIESLEAPLRTLKSGSGEFTLNTANGSWVKSGYQILPAYSELLATLFQSAAFNFSDPNQAVKDVNQWVEKNTKGMIVDLLPPGSITSDTRLVLASALYMLAKWQNPFEKSSTTKRPFTDYSGAQAPVDLMYKSAHFEHGSSAGFQFVRLPYLGGVSFWVLLPDDPAGLPGLEKQLTMKLLSDVFTGTSSKKVNLSIPKIDSSASIGLAQTLEALGITDAFSDDADFSGITGGRDLQISDVIHQAKIKVDEEGTEAAAATAITFRSLSIPIGDKPINFTADHPFLYFIREDTSGTILFMGRFSKP